MLSPLTTTALTGQDSFPSPPPMGISQTVPTPVASQQPPASSHAASSEAAFGDALRAQMLRVQREQGASADFAERAVAAQLAYLQATADKAYPTNQHHPQQAWANSPTSATVAKPSVVPERTASPIPAAMPPVHIAPGAHSTPPPVRPVIYQSQPQSGLVQSAQVAATPQLPGPPVSAPTAPATGLQQTFSDIPESYPAVEPPIQPAESTPSQTTQRLPRNKSARQVMANAIAKMERALEGQPQSPSTAPRAALAAPSGPTGYPVSRVAMTKPAPMPTLNAPVQDFSAPSASGSMTLPDPPLVRPRTHRPYSELPTAPTQDPVDGRPVSILSKTPIAEDSRPLSPPTSFNQEPDSNQFAPAPRQDPMPTQEPAQNDLRSGQDENLTPAERLRRIDEDAARPVDTVDDVAAPPMELPGTNPVRQDMPQDLEQSPFKTCDQYRSQLLGNSIREIALDMSPPASRIRDQYVAISRSWTDRLGNVVATGTMVDLRRGYIILDTEDGRVKIPYGKLSDADWAAVSDYWQIPELCGVGGTEPFTREWVPQTYTWKASALCHKPLYFQNVQLERYGHTHGPVLQPIHSTAHFFVSLFTLPYQTAIHPPNECMYALGYYRPGNCAPWLKNPIPISLDGLRRQALVTTGLSFFP